MKTHFERQRRYYEQKFTFQQTKLTEDFGYQAAWVLEDMIFNHFMMKLFERLELTDVDSLYDSTMEHVLKPYNVMECSTSEMRNMISIIRHKARLSFLEEIKPYTQSK